MLGGCRAAAGTFVPPRGGPRPAADRLPMKFLGSQLAYFLTEREQRSNVRALLRYVILLLAVMFTFTALFHILMIQVEGIREHGFFSYFKHFMGPSPALAPLIDPNEHSCGTVRPHGARELTHAEKDFYIVGMKSYGRAPTFLLATGYEQVRSVVAMLAGDVAAAERVELVLPETGVCNTIPLVGSSTGCCGGPAPVGLEACCVADADAKTAGKAGCGCS